MKALSFKHKQNIGKGMMHNKMLRRIQGTEKIVRCNLTKLVR